LLELGAAFASRDLDKNRLSEGELDTLIGSRDYRQFLNSRNELFREKNMKEHPPSRAAAIKLMARHPNLIRRPMVLCGSQIVLGYDEDAFRALVE